MLLKDEFYNYLTISTKVSVIYITPQKISKNNFVEFFLLKIETFPKFVNKRILSGVLVNLCIFEVYVFAFWYVALYVDWFVYI